MERPPVAEQQPITIAAGTTSQPIRFSKLVLDLDPGDSMGSVQVGVLCAPHTETVFRGDRHSLNNDDLAEVFARELKSANYQAVGDPNALFDDPSAERAEFLVAGLVKEIEAEVCYPLSGFGNFSEAGGEAFMEIAWQIYSRDERAVVFESTSEGYAEVEEAAPGSEKDIFLDAFAQAVRNLLADPAFYVLVGGVSREDGPARQEQVAPASGRSDSLAEDSVTDFANDSESPQ